ncbi:homoserine kinase [Kamptonema cortianum]|nr:homoserine kinase [Oscillatoria laete-virens]MDK3160246.1 homoserine kinase [Kamptonema cortianum]MDL5048400.1 homoserine kinase [Oscillatoria amoena NRMC-F 0135]MDL5055691.1 homoserine kinase [Oscillatoria laete-virens NRMC-F 0139]
MPARTLHIRVPATTANLGPGFDTLGIALQLYNTFTFSFTNEPKILITSEKGQDKVQGAMPLIRASFNHFYKATRITKNGAGFSLDIVSDIPIARGLGSSSTLIVAVLAGLNRMHGKPLKKKDLAHLASAVEGHPDNTTPALVGGFVASKYADGKVSFIRKKLPSKLKFVLLVPPFEMETKKARQILPDLYSREDVVTNVSNSSLLTAAFLEGEYSMVGQFLEDRIHQPYRGRLLPELFDVIAAGKKAGALGGWLSGSGSTICCLTMERAASVAQAMKRSFNKTQPGGQVKILAADNDGVSFL